MQINQIITDYVTRTLLTTAGDMIVRGAAAPERLAGGITGTCLVGKGLGVKPEYKDKKHKMFSPAVGDFSKMGIYGHRIDTVGASCYSYLRVPLDYLRAAEIDIIYNTLAAGLNMHVSLVGYSKKVNTVHSYDMWSIDNLDIGETFVNKMCSYNLTAQFTDFVAGDIICIEVDYSATPIDSNLNVMGISFQYVSS